MGHYKLNCRLMHKCFKVADPCIFFISVAYMHILRLHMKERSVYSINQRRRLEAETRHEREERLQQLSDNQQRKLDTETTALRSRSPHNA